MHSNKHFANYPRFRLLKRRYRKKYNKSQNNFLVSNIFWTFNWRWHICFYLKIHTIKNKDYIQRSYNCINIIGIGRLTLKVSRGLKQYNDKEYNEIHNHFRHTFSMKRFCHEAHPSENSFPYVYFYYLFITTGNV